MCKVIICGSRDWTDRVCIEEAFDKLVPKGSIIIEGGASGADQLSHSVATKRGHEVKRISARWDLYGKGAGPIRNKWMIEEEPDLVIAFHNDIENSKGTKDMLELAKKYRINWVLIVSSDSHYRSMLIEDMRVYGELIE